MANKSVKFYRGNLAAYQKETHADGIYFAQDAGCLLMNGKSYSGISDVEFKDGKLLASYVDANGAISKKEIALGTGKYTPADLTASTAAIGGIAAGTTAKSLNNKSINEVLDMLLYPEYAPNFTDATINFTSTFASPVEVGNTCPAEPAASAATGSPAKTTGGKNVTTGGAATNTFSLNGSNSWNGQILTPTTVTVTATRAYAGSTDTVKTNKDTETNKAVTGSSTTLLSNASAHPWIDDTFHIKPITKTQSKNIKFVYSIYASTATAGTLTKQPIQDTQTRELTLKAGVSLIAVPAVFGSVTIEKYGLGQWFAEAATKSATQLAIGDGTTKIAYNQFQVTTTTADSKFRVIYK